MAQQVLKHLVQKQDRQDHDRFDPEGGGGEIRHQAVAAQGKEQHARRWLYPRQVAMYLVKELTDASLPEIGRAFGGKHHTTVIHSINKIEEQRVTMIRN